MFIEARAYFVQTSSVRLEGIKRGGNLIRH